MFTVPLLWKELLLLQFIFFLFFFCSMQFKFVHSELINRSNNSFHSGVSNFPINFGSKKQLEGNEGHLCFSITLLYTVYCWTFATVPNNSYRFWADLLHKWSFLGYMTDIHEYIQNVMPTYYINQVFMGYK